MTTETDPRTFHVEHDGRGFYIADEAGVLVVGHWVEFAGAAHEIDRLVVERHGLQPDTPVEMVLGDWYGTPLGTRLRHCLAWENIGVLEDLLSKSETELLEIPHFGRRTMDLLEEALAARGLKLRDSDGPRLGREHHGLWLNFDY